MQNLLTAPLAGRRAVTAGALVSVAGIGLTIAACGSSSSSASTPRASTSSPTARIVARQAEGSSAGAGGATACAGATAATRATVDGYAARHIYASELSSKEVDADIAHIVGSRALADAVARNDRAATRAAVNALVYAPHLHIVRLRATRNGRLLADVGGPLIIAPVSGDLRRNGRVVGRYVMAVQDDAGYVKLVTRFINDPVVLRSGSRTVMSTVSSPPRSIPARGPVRFRGQTYEAYSFNATAFPSGPLRVSLLVKPVASSVSSMPCTDVQTYEVARVASIMFRRFALLHQRYPSFVSAAGYYTGSLVLVRRGSQQLAGSAPGPASLPEHGQVSYRGIDYRVASFTGPAGVRVYLLVAPGAIG